MGSICISPEIVGLQSCRLVGDEPLLDLVKLKAVFIVLELVNLLRSHHLDLQKVHVRNSLPLRACLLRRLCSDLEGSLVSCA